MEFDIQAMKQRARGLMTGAYKNLWAVGVMWVILACAYWVADIMLCYTENGIIICFGFLAIEIICGFFRNGFKWYCLSVAREENVFLRDVGSLFITKPVGQLLLNLLKTICYFIGCMFLWIGSLIPFYCFRFAVYIMRDEGINPFRAVDKNFKLLKGHWSELIKLDVTNIGWILAMLCTCGLAGIYVKPYMTLVYAEFYDYLKGQYELLG